MRFLITTLAEYQTPFWLGVGTELRRLGHDAAFVSFDDPSTELIRGAGFPVFSGRDEAIPGSASQGAVLLEQVEGRTLNSWLTHERFAFGIDDTAALRQKLLRAMALADRACRSWAEGGPFTMVQELGGFLSVIGSYFAARRHGVDNWFAEPSFFRGRLFFIRNSFAALQISAPAASAPSEVLGYLQETVASSAIVIPLKDIHQYTTAWKKIVNSRNAKRLTRKLVDKYVHGTSREFGYIGNHVAQHLRMLRNALRLRNRYTPLADCGRFVYYPLHVPGDMALTLRTPHLLDQLGLIDFVCRSAPDSHVVAIKEHPAMIGAMDAGRLLELLNRYDNLRLLAPANNNYRVLERADAVVSVNSKTGAEAALLGKPVLVLGDAFYRHSPLVTAVDNLKDLPAALAAILATPPARPDADAVARYFAAVWSRSLPGELYVDSPDNVRAFARSMIAAIEEPGSC
ncbi:MAG: hypothetical protein ABIQ06_14670 [Caldimonas sp.]